MDESTTLPDTRRAWLALLAAIGLAAFAGWFLVGGGIELLRPRPAGPGDRGDVGQPAPEFALTSVDGGTVRLSEHRGRVVLLNFWATWCAPCRAEMPDLQRTYQAYRDRGFEVLAIDVQEAASDVQPFLAELSLTFPALLDQDAAVSRLYLARGLPSSFLVDRQGTVRYVRVGTLAPGVLEDELKKLGL
jgi:peroxiredoxin